METKIFWDGKATLPFVYDDGGRAAANYKGTAGDCVARSIAIVTGKQYSTIYTELSNGATSERGAKRGRTARSSGCKVHLVNGELPLGRLVVSLSKHYTAVINGVVHDTYDPQRQTLITDGGVTRIAHRCVYGYWSLPEHA